MNITTAEEQDKKSIVADLVVYDQQGNTILVVEYLGDLSEEITLKNLRIYLEYTEKYTDRVIPFVLIAGFTHLKFFRWDGQNFSLILTLNTPDILSEYDQEFSHKKIFWDYFLGLVESWLHDFQFHWKYAEPPAKEQLEKIDLLDLLAYGTTFRNVNVYGDPVR
jgi:hypothetical protein